MLLTSLDFFFVEYTKKLRIISLRREKRGTGRGAPLLTKTPQA